MEKDNIKLIWQKMHSYNDPIDDVDIERIIKKKHSEIIVEALNVQRLKIMLYSVVSIVYIGLIVYAFVILKLNLSAQAIIPLSLAGLFLLVKTVFEINGFRLLNSTTCDDSVKESILAFKQKLDNIRMIDFISALVYCYSWVVGIVLILFADFAGLAKSWLPFLVFLILIFLIIPWLMKYFHPRYKNLYMELDKSIKFLNSTVYSKSNDR